MLAYMPSVLGKNIESRSIIVKVRCLEESTAVEMDSTMILFEFDRGNMRVNFG